MRRLCVIGDPVGHSKSPAIQTAMLRTLGLEGEYLCKPVKLGEEAAFLAEMRAGLWQGCNVTTPLKAAVIPHLDEVDEVCAKCGAVNTISNREGKLYGFTTDGVGFLQSMLEVGADPKGKTVTLLGAGGAAKPVACALAQAGVKTLFCANRTVEKAELLCQLVPGVGVPADFSTSTLCKLAGQSHILVNATTLGMGGLGRQFEDFSFLEALPDGAPVFDLIYFPDRTELLRRAAVLGHPAHNGTGMLLHQAVIALGHFLGRPVDPALVLPAARAALADAGR